MRYPTIMNLTGNWLFFMTVTSLVVTNWYGFNWSRWLYKLHSPEWSRNAQGNVEPPYNRHDSSLVKGWYRFQEEAGDQMPDKCVLKYRCGTERPGWLNGAHPTVAEGVVTRKVCYSVNDDCCYWNKIIKVKNCSSYYVYELQKTPSFSRYCGNAGAGKLHRWIVLIANLNDWKYTMSLKYVDKPRMSDKIRINKLI